MEAVFEWEETEDSKLFSLHEAHAGQQRLRNIRKALYNRVLLVNLYKKFLTVEEREFKEAVKFNGSIEECENSFYKSNAIIDRLLRKFQLHGTPWQKYRCTTPLVLPETPYKIVQ